MSATPIAPAVSGRPRIDPALRFVGISDTRGVLIGDWRAVPLSGRLLVTLATLLDGTRAEAELVALLSGRFNILDVRYGVSRLRALGCLHDENPGTVTDSAPTMPPFRGRDRVAGEASRATPSRALLEALRQRRPEGGAHVIESHDPSRGIALILATDYLDTALWRDAARLQAEGVDVLLAKPRGEALWIGPVLRAEGRLCWHCARTRLRRNLRVHEWLRRARPDVRRTGRNRVPRTLGSDLVARSAAGASIGPAAPETDGCLWTWEPDTGTCRTRRLRPLPGCPVCGPPAEDPLPDEAPLIGAGLDVHPGDPGQVLGALEPLVDPVAGVVSAYTSLPSTGAVHMCAASHPIARTPDTWEGLTDSLRRCCVGKGRTAAEARLGALAEAVERYAGMRHGDEPVLRSTLRDLGDRAIDPNHVQLFSEAQYAERGDWNRSEAHSNWIPEPLGIDTAIDWSPVWSLSGGAPRYLPTDYLYYPTDLDGHQVNADPVGHGPSPERSRFVRAHSNGCAAGSSIPDAMLRALCELVERDAVAIWWYNRVVRPRIDLDALTGDDLPALVRGCRDACDLLVVLDITTDLGIPAVAAVGAPGADPDDIVLGFGAHPDPARAARRALAELGQGLASPTGVTGGPPAFTPGALDPEFIFDPGASDARAGSRSRVPGRAPRAGDGSPPPRDALRWCVSRLALRDLEVFVLDQTRPDTGLPVVRMIVPELRPHWARFAPGRLYDTPVLSGWLDHPRDESDLNPAHLFL